MYTHDYTRLYDIRYNPVSHMFDLFYRGEQIDRLLPCYADGETAILLHQEVQHANDEAWAWALNPLTVAVEIIRKRYPGAVWGMWNDYVTAFVVDLPVDEDRLEEMKKAPYAVIVMPDGYAVHHIVNGSLTAHIETIRVPVEAPRWVTISPYKLAA